jgi:exodeoxyribonuclease III
MCLQETKVQDEDFPVDAIRSAGYHASFRGMKAYNGVATLTRTSPEKARTVEERLAIRAW